MRETPFHALRCQHASHISLIYRATAHTGGLPAQAAQEAFIDTHPSSSFADTGRGRLADKRSASAQHVVSRASDLSAGEGADAYISVTPDDLPPIA